MSEPAYDERPLIPRPVEINALASAQALRWAQRLAIQAGADPHDFRSVMWVCFTDAARTERTLPTPGPRGYSSGWPDCWQTPGEIAGAYNDRFSEMRTSEAQGRQFDDELYRPKERPEPARSAMISRYEAVTSWLRLCHADDKRRAINLVWWRAHGRPYGWISRQDGRPPKRLRHERARQVVIIETALRKNRGLTS